MTSRSPVRVSVRPSTAWDCAGNARGIAWLAARRRGVRPKGAQAWAVDTPAHCRPHARRNDDPGPPPLYHCYGRRGQQGEVPVTGGHAKRDLHGAINLRRTARAFLITEVSA